MKSNVDLNQWKEWSWQSATRYYTLLVDRDLFGQWVLTRKWGGKFTKIHRYKKEYCDPDHIDKLFAQINQRRLSRGYALMQQF